MLKESRLPYRDGARAAGGGGRRTVIASDIGRCGDRKKREGEGGKSDETREHLVVSELEVQRLRAVGLRKAGRVSRVYIPVRLVFPGKLVSEAVSALANVAFEHRECKGR